MRRGAWLALWLAALTVAPARADFSDHAVALNSGQFLQMGPGARALAMGEAYTAVADDASAVFWNPAGMHHIPRGSLLVMHADYVAAIKYQHASAAWRIGPATVIGGGFQMLDAGKIDRTNAVGQDIGTFHPRDQLYTLSFAHDLELVAFDRQRYSFGVSLKYLESTIVDKASAWTFDLGILTRDLSIGERPLQIAFGLYNVTGHIKYDVKKDPLPQTIKAGGSLTIAPGWIVSTDLIFPRYGNIAAAAGTEYELSPFRGIGIVGRAGVNSLGVENQTGLGGFSFGGGLRVAFLRLDYAFVPMGELGETHRASMTIEFGGKLKSAEPSLFDIQRRLLEPD